MFTTTKLRRASRSDSPATSEKRRAGFARGLALDAHRKNAWALHEPDFQDRRPNEAPRQLGDVAAEHVGDVGEAALDHWLREAARTEGEEHKVALQIAQEIAAMIGVPWAEVMSEQAA
jgi:hypothetical protein